MHSVCTVRYATDKNETHISPGELGFIHSAKVREPSAPSFCEGGETRHPSPIGRNNTLLDPPEAPSELGEVPVCVWVPGRVSLLSSVTQVPLVEESIYMSTMSFKRTIKVFSIHLNVCPNLFTSIMLSPKLLYKWSQIFVILHELKGQRCCTDAVAF